MAKAIVFDRGSVKIDKNFHEEGHEYCTVCDCDVTGKLRHMKQAVIRSLGNGDSLIPILCSERCCDTFVEIKAT